MSTTISHQECAVDGAVRSRTSRATRLAYGYMKVPQDINDEKVRVMEIRLRAFASDMGLVFCRFFYEFTCGSTAAFNDLIEELQHVDAHYVLVPTVRHFASHPLLQDLMISHLQIQAHATVFELIERRDLLAHIGRPRTAIPIDRDTP